MKGWWRRKRKEPRDRHREFIYLDEVSVVSLLAALEGEIKQSVTNTLTRAQESASSTSAAIPKGVIRSESKFSSTRSTTNEVVRRAVIQSTFRDLWRRDVGVLLHDTNTGKRKRRTTVSDSSDLSRSLAKLKREKLAVSLANVRRGDILEIDVRLDADEFFKKVTVGATLLDLMEGKEPLFGVAAADVRQVAPMIEVLKELSVGLVPVRGIATSHCVIDYNGESLIVAREALHDALLSHARDLELVGFTEADSYWRDLRRTLFSRTTFTAYVRVERTALSGPWNPIKLVDLLDAITPGLRDEVADAFHGLNAARNDRTLPQPTPETKRFQLTRFAADLTTELNATPAPDEVDQAIASATASLANATTVTERRRAFDVVAEAIGGADIDRELVRSVRSRWMDAYEGKSAAPAVEPTDHPDPQAPVQLEVGFVALYW
jgi:hypothetical protein